MILCSYKYTLSRPVSVIILHDRSTHYNTEVYYNMEGHISSTSMHIQHQFADLQG